MVDSFDGDQVQRALEVEYSKIVDPDFDECVGECVCELGVDACGGEAVDLFANQTDEAAAEGAVGWMKQLPIFNVMRPTGDSHEKKTVEDRKSSL